jgi:oxaloacetate decarboxylase beta subunit
MIGELVRLTLPTPGQWLMLAVGLTLLALAILKNYEPSLLLPIGFGCVLANLPLTGITDPEGLLGMLYASGVMTELFPLLIFIGIGAMIDFTPLLAMPRMALLGAAGQFGIFLTLLLAAALGFSLEESAAIGVIGAIDGPTSIFVASRLAPELLSPIAVAAYSYMALVPVIQPPLMRLLTTRSERRIQMSYAPRPVSRLARVLFPILATIGAGLLVPTSLPLVGSLMLGNLMRESGVVDRLAKSAQNEMLNIVTLFLGLAIGGSMRAETFLQRQTLTVLALGLLAFAFDTVAGLLGGKLLCVFSGRRLNPLIGAAGISAFPMAGRLAAQMAQDEDYQNFLLMHAMGANTAGQLGSVLAAGLLMGLVAVLG